MRLRFFRSIVLLSAVLALALAWPATAWATPDVLRSIIAAGAIAFVNVVLGFIILAYAIDKPTSPFMVAAFGGMGIRMALILVVLAILLMSGYHALSLALGLMGFYVAYMVVEIVFVLRELNSRTSTATRRDRSTSDFLAPRTMAANLKHVDARS